MVLRSQVLRRLNALKHLSASAEDAGHTSSIRTNFSTSQYSPRVSWTIALSALAVSSTDLGRRFRLKSGSWSLMSLTSSSVYGARTSSSAVPESSVFNRSIFDQSYTVTEPLPQYYCTAVSISTENIKLVPIALRTETIFTNNALSTQRRHSEDNVNFYCWKTVEDTRPMTIKPYTY